MDIDIEFRNIIREKMTEKQFWKWVSSWKDTDVICREAENWNKTDKKETIKDFQAGQFN